MNRFRQLYPKPRARRGGALVWLTGVAVVAAAVVGVTHLGSGPVTIGSALPIQPARTFMFETTEGSDMNVDLSPDGRTIIFDMLGDLYTVPVTGGTATQLTRGLALDRRPVWSPDGKQIAFISDGGGAEAIWMMDANGKNPRPVTAERPSACCNMTKFFEAEWLADGATLVSDDTLYDLKGTESPRSLGLSAGWVRASQDGRYLYFNAAQMFRTSSSERWESRSGLRRYDRTTQAVTELAPDLKFATSSDAPVISPDGAWLVFGRSNLKIRNLATGAERLLVDSMQRSGRSGRMVFTSDSREVIAAYGGHIHRIDIATGKDVLIPFRAKVQADLGPLVHHEFRLRNDSLRVRYVRAPTVSPDGKTLTFSALNALYTMALPRGTPRKLTAGNLGQFQPAYSPDGRWIAYVSWSDVAGGHVWRMPSGGGSPERLTTVAAHYQWPAWSPDGASLVVLKGDTSTTHECEGGVCSLAILPIAGGALRPVIDSVSPRASATFSADGQRLLFLTQERSEDGSYAVLNSVRPDASEHRVLARVTSPASDGSAVRRSTIAPSPDGRYVAFTVDRQLYLTRLASRMSAAANGAKPAALDWTEAVQLTYGAMDARWAHDGTLIYVVANQVFRLEPERALAQGPRGRQPRGATAPVDDTIVIQLAASRHVGRGNLVLRGARLITMKGNEVIEDGTVVIANDRIVAVGPSAKVKVPSGATIIDVRGATIIPGMLDLHAHVEQGQPRTEEDFRSDWVYPANLAYGVTTIRDAHTSLGVYGDAERIEAGQLLGPRVFTAGPGFEPSAVRIESLEDARTLVQYRKSIGGVVIKNYAARPRRWQHWVHRAAYEVGLNVIVHTDFSDIAAAIDGATGHEHRADASYDDRAQLRAKAQTWNTPTLHTQAPYGVWVRAIWNDPKYRRFTPAWWIEFNGPGNETESRYLARVSNIRHSAVVRLGGHVTVGGHGDFHGTGTHFEMWALRWGGLTNHEALRAATLHGASGLGMEKDLGSLEVGKLADLIVLEKNPLEDIRNSLTIRSVIKNGILYDGETLNTLWPRK